ncbi:unnamed protein product, partial [Iphiclides podalirius]
MPNIDGALNTIETLETIKRQERHSASLVWRARLSQEQYAHKRVIEAILPVFEAWMQRRQGRLTYRLTQLITGHGCDGSYEDSATHTLVVCPAWETKRNVLVTHIGRNLSLSAVMSAMLRETVMVKKEAAETDRERADPLRRRGHRGEGTPRYGPQYI